jgi:Ca2+-binding RTX toxin-like protein
MNSQLELLESRRMLSVQLSDSTVQVKATHSDDRILISLDQRGSKRYVIEINGVTHFFDVGRVDGINVESGAGRDRVEVSDTFDRIDASITIKGGSGDDILIGGRGTDTLIGQGGDDTLIGGSGGDELIGDGFFYSHGQGHGNDLIVGGGGADFLDGGSGDDTLMGGRANDTLQAGGGDDSVAAGAGDDEIWGGSGDDQISGGHGKDFLDGEAGDDYVLGGASHDSVFGNEGNDQLIGGGGDDYIMGDDDNRLEPALTGVRQAGDDLLNGGNGQDTLVGSHESDGLAYDNGKDTMIGGRGNDLIDARVDDVLVDRSSGDHVPVLDNRAGSGPLVITQTAHLSILKKFNDMQGNDVPVPAGIGRFGPRPTFFTSDGSGTLHMQDTVNRPFTLGEFLENWGYEGPRGYLQLGHLRINVNGEAVADEGNVVVHGGDEIEIIYGHR